MNKDAKEELLRYAPIANAIAQTFGDNCEVVLHDLSTPQNSVIYTVNNHVTGRMVGQPINHIFTRVLLSKKFQNDVVANYQTQTDDGRRIKSTTALIRDKDGVAIGALCINFDYQSLLQFQDFLNNFTSLEDEPIKEEVELLGNVKEIANQLIQQIIGDYDVDTMDKSKKIEVVKFMDEKGVFLIKGAVEKVAESLQVSKVTIYSYLDQIRSDRAEA
ncbi:PAS domain-containing protein [Paenibacillus filicis]|uniref:PAS domain-containing protein n=1 Tax=Paenibacillus gyeongsangnamensis TaxID=3388067 RepID=A0ABT4Q3T3_9BACL|nr:PAS domain-containing protein [Paenibacillus filicis]MCZ8511524.1 PAS domain-containing protein [Paenibacillus filicis]